MGGKMAKYMKTLHVPSVEGNVIYSLLEEMRKSAREFMPMVNAPVVTATAEVLQVGSREGCYVDV